MTEQQNKLEIMTKRDKETLKTIFYPGRLSRFLCESIDPKKEPLLDVGMYVTGWFAQALIYSTPIISIYGTYKMVAEKIF